MSPDSNNPAPRANAGSRAIFKSEHSDTRTSTAESKANGVRPSRPRKPQDARRPSGPINFAEINRAALTAFPAVLARLLPNGKRVGAELVALNPRRADRRLGSFKVNRWTGRWADFATGDKGGDPISLVAYLANVSQGEAAQLLARMLGIEGGGPRHG